MREYKLYVARTFESEEAVIAYKNPDDLARDCAIAFMNPSDMDAEGFGDECLIVISSSSIELCVKAKKCEGVPRGCIIMPLSPWSLVFSEDELNPPCGVKVRVRRAASTAKVHGLNEIFEAITLGLP